ncbi:LytR family transcriptional attenuator [Nocardioides sp. J9]|uniref:LCP family protein n=1 Tax=Nocardioides sp. J9 TaxID=935844 RepID=UPI0011A70167|nr:LCP family protein [Nocardioides sp. J9]TWG90937.1 LytR family transcriptional attenuator [Nocardioides sp. J9]TWH00733.1 LytR family transcriptional attenuator [Nocardioides sp. J9]
MAGRGDDDGDFDWMYGSGPDRGGDDPEPTRRLPVQPRGGVSPPRKPDRLPPAQQYGATPEPDGPPPPPPWAPRRSRWKRPGTWVRLVLLLLVVWLVFLVAVPVFTWTKVDKVDFEPKGERPGDQPGTTYLLVGNDSRKGLSKEERRRLNTGDFESELTDTIMLLHTGDGPTTLVSIPRDSPLEIPGHGRSKVNSAYAKGGTPLLVQTLEQATGLRIDGYVEIGLGGLVGVVDAVGGIEICPKQRIRDRPAGLFVKKGCQEVDGATALAYSRARKYSPISDLARVQQQREVVAAVGDKVLSPWSVINPVRYWQLNSAVPDFFRFGEGMGPWDAGQWALAMTDKGKSCTVPLAGGDATWDDERAQQLFDIIAEDRTDDITRKLCTPTGLPPQ